MEGYTSAPESLRRSTQLFLLRRNVPLEDIFAVLLLSAPAIFAANMSTLAPTLHLPPHVQEVCALLAKGILRLCRDAAADRGHDVSQSRLSGEISLHSVTHLSGHRMPSTEKHT